MTHHPSRAETRVAELEAECVRHRNANLLRAVLGGRDWEIDEWITEAINAEDFDRVPWMVAERVTAERSRLLQRVKALEEALLAEKRKDPNWDPTEGFLESFGFDGDEVRP